jgi:hypothetical protein
MATWIQINDGSSASGLDVPSMLAPTVGPQVPASCIDNCYERMREILMAGTVANLATFSGLGPMLLLGLVSSVEAYFRDILARMLSMCPVCQREAGALTIPLRALSFYDESEIGLAFFEGSSLAGKKALVDQVKKISAVDLQRDADLNSALDEFDKLCELRHAAAHFRGRIGSGNLKALQVDAQAGTSFNLTTVGQLHQVQSVCHNVVRLANQNLFDRTLERFVVEAVFVGDWAADRVKFSGLYFAFVARGDASVPRNVYLAYLRIRPRIIARMAATV